MKPENQRHKHIASVASHVPGRLRVKLAHGCRKPHIMSRIGEHLRGKEGIHDVRLNGTTGSVTVAYDRRKHDRDGIYRIFEDLDVIISDLTASPHIEGTTSVSGESTAPFTFIGATEDLNRRLSEITGVEIDLKTALPLGLAGLGVWSIVRNGMGIEKIPGVLFLWLAFDTFVKLHPHPVRS